MGIALSLVGGILALTYKEKTVAVPAAKRVNNPDETTITTTPQTV